MTDEMNLAPVVRSWLKETLPPASESSRVFDAAIREARTKRQQRHPWPPLPLPSTRPSGRDRVHDRKTRTPTATDTADYQPSLIPAVNGHAPTVIGRTQTMFSPVKAITAGALVFAIGGVLLIAQPFGQQGSGVPGAATEVAPPVEFTAVLASGPCEGEGTQEETTERVGDVRQNRGAICRVWWEPSEPMLEGSGTVSLNSNEHADETGRRVAFGVETSGYSVVNEQGAWRERPRVNFEMANNESDSFDFVMYGEGDYEGLTVVAVVEGRGLVSDSFESLDGYMTSEVSDVRGFIIDGGLPPAPENTSTK